MTTCVLHFIVVNIQYCIWYSDTEVVSYLVISRIRFIVDFRLFALCLHDDIM